MLYLLEFRVPLLWEAHSSEGSSLWLFILEVVLEGAHYGCKHSSADIWLVVPYISMNCIIMITGGSCFEDVRTSCFKLSSKEVFSYPLRNCFQLWRFWWHTSLNTALGRERQPGYRARPSRASAAQWNCLEKEIVVFQCNIQSSLFIIWDRGSLCSDWLESM